MWSQGYFQLKATPGVWQLKLRSGRSKDLYEITRLVHTCQKFACDGCQMRRIIVYYHCCNETCIEMCSHEFTDSPSDSPNITVVMDSFKSKIIRVRVGSMFSTLLFCRKCHFVHVLPTLVGFRRVHFRCFSFVRCKNRKARNMKTCWLATMSSRVFGSLYRGQSVHCTLAQFYLCVLLFSIGDEIMPGICACVVALAMPSLMRRRLTRHWISSLWLLVTCTSVFLGTFQSTKFEFML